MKLVRAALLALALAAPAQAQAVLTDAQVREFVSRQERAWNAGEVDRYFAPYAAGAVFTDQARTGKGEIVPYGRATLAQAKAQARRFFAKSKVNERGTIQRIEFAPDRRSARVISQAVSRVETGGRAQVTCIARVQTLVLAGARVSSTGQTDTLSRCRRQP